MVKVIVNHLNSPQAHFRKYFSTDIDSGKQSWIRKSFVTKLLNVTHLSLKAHDKFASLSSNKSLKFLF